MLTYKNASKIAIDICHQLNVFCEVINIAGSLRRGVSEIKDIDLICVPRYTEVVQLGIFGDSKFSNDHNGHIATRKASVNFTDTVKRIGAITKGSPDGRYMSLNVKGHKVDVFMPEAVDYYRQYCIRTGSAKFVHWNIANAWSKKGWCGTDQGLRRIEDCREVASAAEKKKWEIVNSNGEKPPAWESEEHFFEWLGVKWIAPRLRTI